MPHLFVRLHSCEYKVLRFQDSEEMVSGSVTALSIPSPALVRSPLQLHCHPRDQDTGDKRCFPALLASGGPPKYHKFLRCLFTLAQGTKCKVLQQLPPINCQKT